MNVISEIKGRVEYEMSKRNTLWGLPFLPTIPYPLRAAKLSLDINPFGFWFRPRFTYRSKLTEAARANGETIWWARWAWFQISYSRWV